MVPWESVAIFRRFDFWVVTGFLLLGGLYVGATQLMHRRLKAPSKIVQVVLDPAAPAPAKGKEPGSAAVVLPFAVEASAWKEGELGHWLLEMRVRYRNERDEPEHLIAPKAGVVTGSGEALEPFFLSISPPPEIPPHAEQAVDLRYWVREEQAQGKLWLQVDGQRIPIEGPPARAAL